MTGSGVNYDILAVGLIDKFLTGNPSVTFFYKDFAVDAECPLGKGARVAFTRTPAQALSGRSDAEIDALGVAGIYEEGLEGGSKVCT